MAEELVYHYTSVESLFQIVKSRRFRLGNIFFMNDSMEVKWCFNLALEMMKDRGGERFDAISDQIRQARFEYIFCVCFSAVDDDLSQWRGYADDGRGVVIGVDISKVIEGIPGCVKAIKVEYEEEIQKAEVDEMLQEFLATPQGESGVVEEIHRFMMHNRLSTLAVNHKNPASSREQETRLVLRPSFDRPSGMNDQRYAEACLAKFPHGVEFWPRGGSLVPYADIDLPLEAIRSIRLGPKFGGGMAKDAMQLFLSKEGVSENVIENISRSVASYR